MALDNTIKDVILCTDLSQLNTLFGLKSGNCKNPCTKCKYVSNLTKKEKNEINPCGSFEPRTAEDWIACRNKLRENSNRKKVGCSNLSVINEPIGEKLMQAHLEKDCISPPPLHLYIGLTNALFQSIQKLDVGGKIIGKWFDEAKISLSEADHGKLNGPRCYKMLKPCETIKNADGHEDFKKYYDLLKLLEKSNALFNKVGKFEKSDRDQQKEVIQKIGEKWSAIPSL